MPLISSQLANFRVKEQENRNLHNGGFSFLEITPKNVILSIFKISEDKKGIIVRFFETEGKRSVATLRFGLMIKSQPLPICLKMKLKSLRSQNVAPYKWILIRIGLSH